MKRGDKIMVKKGIFIIITVIAVVCVFSACARKAEKMSVVPETEEKRTTV